MSKVIKDMYGISSKVLQNEQRSVFVISKLHIFYWERVPYWEFCTGKNAS